jgi:hypothetical protein
MELSPSPRTPSPSKSAPGTDHPTSHGYLTGHCSASLKCRNLHRLAIARAMSRPERDEPRSGQDWLGRKTGDRMLRFDRPWLAASLTLRLGAVVS